MSSFHVGMKVEIDTFGLNVAAAAAADHAYGIVVALHPGAITVRLNGAGPGPSEVTVSASRVLGSVNHHTKERTQ